MVEALVDVPHGAGLRGGVVQRAAHAPERQGVAPGQKQRDEQAGQHRSCVEQPDIARHATHIRGQARRRYPDFHPHPAGPGALQGHQILPPLAPLRQHPAVLIEQAHPLDGFVRKPPGQRGRVQQAQKIQIVSAPEQHAGAARIVKPPHPDRAREHLFLRKG